MSEMIAGIKYTKPQVVLLNESGIGVPEYAARTCYDSFDASENESVKDINRVLNDEDISDTPAQDILLKNYINGNGGKRFQGLNNIEESKLLDDLAWTYFHHSILEHTTLSYLIKGTSRGVLQEHARHRIQAISVRSTRYTMSTIINAFVASQKEFDPADWFYEKIKELNMFVVDGDTEWLEITQMYNKLQHQYVSVGKEKFIEISIAKSSLDFLAFGDADDVFTKLQEGKKKRNVGDAFKWIVTDNWKVDMVVTFNLRSLKNYFDLRDSGAAYFQIQWLAQEMKSKTPEKYLKLIDKKYKGK